MTRAAGEAASTVPLVAAGLAYGVVLVFVTIMMALVYGLDYLFGWGVAWVFGDGTFSG